MEELIASLKAKGFEVYGPEKRTTYCYFTDGTKIGHAQVDRMRGVTYTTVHRANRESGTGFQARNTDEALMTIPPGFPGVVAPQKFRDFETFRKQHWQPLVQY